LSLIVAGHALIALPLAVVAIMGVLNAKQLAQESNRLLAGGVHVTEQSQLLEEEMVAMERAARQYQVLGDPGLKRLFDEHNLKVDALLTELGRLQPYGMGDWDLQRTLNDVGILRAAMQGENPNAPELETALEVFGPLHQRVSSITDLARAFVASEASTVQRTAAHNNEKLLLLCMVMLPLAGLVALILAVYVTLPLQRIDRAIRSLGAHKLDARIAIGGPVELRQLGQQLDWLRVRLRTVEQDKNRFLRQMAHELKTPLASVREGAELLVDGVLGHLSNKQQEVATILRNNSFELQMLIENLLDYEEWREKSGKLERTRFPLKPLVEQCVKRYRLILASQQITLAERCSDVEIYADRTRLRMTLDNLISNALKFSPKTGTVTLIADVETVNNHRSGCPQRLIVEVADEGPGIPHAERTRIFEPFYQSGPPMGRHLEGTGIGLSVVRDCVDAHGGSVEIVDGRYPGAHFRIQLPLPAVPAEAERA
jgi:two-component system sensor histidine kinase GlrK